MWLIFLKKPVWDYFNNYNVWEVILLWYMWWVSWVYFILDIRICFYFILTGSQGWKINSKNNRNGDDIWPWSEDDWITHKRKSASRVSEITKKTFTIMTLLFIFVWGLCLPVDSPRWVHFEILWQSIIGLKQWLVFLIDLNIELFCSVLIDK